ncbi:MAG: hypothetical protein ACOYN0_08515 [Phycisphaerales bacterium]
MNLDLDERKYWNAAAVAALIVPALAVLAVRTLSPALGPAMARARESEPEEATQSILSRPTTDDQRRLLATFQGIDSQEFGATPLRAAALPIDPISHLPAHPTDAAPKLADPATLFELTSIAGSADQPLAVINSKVRSVGSPLGEGWTLVQVHFAEGAVELEHQTGARAWIYIPRLEGLQESPTQPPSVREQPR